MIVLILGNTSSSVLTFRGRLIKKLLDEKKEVIVTCVDDIYKKDIESMGVKFILLPFENRSINPFSFKKLENKYFELIKKIKPDLVFTYMLKPNLFGTVAARKAGIKKIIALNEGRGDAFGNGGLVGKFKEIFAVSLHRRAFKNISKVIVLNHTDFNYFLKKKIATKNQLELIPGVGVNIKYFTYCDKLAKEKNVIMISRLIKNKGVFDFCEVAKIVKEKRKDINFTLLGPEQTITKKDLEPYIKAGCINYHEPVKDVRPFVENSRILVLPSFYNEGFGLVLAEAMAMGRCPIAYHNCGPDEVINDGNDGFLIDAHDIKTLSNKILEIIDNDKLLLQIGKNGKKKVDNSFESEIINNQFLKIFNSI